MAIDMKRDAVIAALRNLAVSMRVGLVHADTDDAIGDILTSAGEHCGLSSDEIDELAEAINFGEYVLVQPHELKDSPL